MTAQQLKNSILQMAVQGKLVPQDPTDEPASVLIERISAEKTQLVKEKKIKKEKSPSRIFRGEDGLFYEEVGDEVKCIHEDLPFDVPESWEWVRLGGIISLTSGQDLTPEKYNASNNGIPYITGASNIENEKVIINRWTEFARSKAYRGDLLLTCKGTVGTMAFLEEDEVHIARQIMAISTYSVVNLSYLKVFLHSFVTVLKATAKSMIPGISRDDVISIFCSLPPLAEQQRIVDKYNELLPSIEKYDTAHSKIERLNKNFPEQLKKSVLQWAVGGKLEEQDPTDEPASVLVERIRAEKEQLVKDGKIKKDKQSSTIYKKDGSYFERTGGTERCIDEEIPFDIPESWEWVRLSEISNFIGAGGDKPTVFSEDKNIKCQIPIYSNGEKNKGLYGFTDFARISEPSITISGRGTIGFSCIRYEPYVPIVRLISITPSKNISIKYLYYVFCILFEKGVGTSIQQLTVPMITPKLIPLPPLAEQQRIVDKVDEVLGLLTSRRFPHKVD